MKKTIIALATLGAMAGAAHAQSTVTLYGLVDMYVGESTTKDQTGTTAKKGMSLSSGGLNGSRWGLRGSEDLGGGLKAIFQLEAGINADDGTVDAGFNRTSKLGLSGGFGSIEFGRQYTRMFSMVDTYDAQGTDSFSAAFNTIWAGPLEPALRWDNSIVYTAPAMGGFSASAQYAFRENGTPLVSAGKSLGLLAGYATGPVSVHVAYETIKTMGGANTAKTTGLGASYDFGMVKTFAQFINQKDGAVGGVSENAYVLGLSVPVGAGTFNAGYGNERQKTAGVRSSKATSYGIEYRYDLSKRTTAYAALGHLKETAVPANTYVKTQNYGVGIRHKF